MARDHFDTLIVYMKGLTQGWIIGESNYDWAEMPKLYTIEVYITTFTRFISTASLV